MRHSHSITDNPGQLFSVAAIAAAVGAMTAMLVTPRSGRQVRQGIRRRATQMRDEMTQRVEDIAPDELTDTAEKTNKRLRSTASKVADDAKTTASKVAEDTKDTAKDAKSAADESRRR